MPRIGLTLIALIVFAGCRAPGFDPLGLTGPDRVPPPPTGAVGGYGGYGGNDSGYYGPVPRPNVGQGAANWPASNFVPASQFAQDNNSTIPGRAAIDPPVANSMTADSRPSLQTSSQLNWVDPLESQTAPGLRPSTGPMQPLVSAPPRVRGFRAVAGRRDLYIPEELAHLRSDVIVGNGVRQASATSNWQQRYDDVRR